MTTQRATVAPPAVSAPRRYTEQIHALTDRQTKEYILGLAVIAADLDGRARPKEGESVRTLLDEAIAARYAADRPLYERAVRAGREELAARERAA